MRQPSLTRRLLAWILGALLVVWAGFVMVGFRTGLHEADELTDGHLASVAALLLNLRDNELVLHRDEAAGSLVDINELKSHDYQQSMSVVMWGPDGRVLAHLGEAPVPPFSRAEGFANLALGAPATHWRTFARWDKGERPRRVMVLLRQSERDDLAWDIAGQIAEPGFWLLPVIALVLGLAVRRGLTPLYDLSRDVHAWDLQRRQPLALRHPQREFQEVVDAINALLERNLAALSRERALADELAHELRTPLASIALHARTLQGELPATDRQAATARLEQDALRAGQVLAQVLALARASRSELAEAAQTVDLAALARQVVSEHAPIAVQSDHEVGLSAPDRLTVHGHPVLLEIALRNLVENALRHTPAGTTVEVQLDPQGRWMQVCDDGRDHDHDHDHDHDRTGGDQRQGGGAASSGLGLGLGLGLGHRVIDKVAHVHGGRFGPEPPPPGFSTCYRVWLQAPAAP